MPGLPVRTLRIPACAGRSSSMANRTVSRAVACAPSWAIKDAVFWSGFVSDVLWSMRVTRVSSAASGKYVGVFAIDPMIFESLCLSLDPLRIAQEPCGVDGERAARRDPGGDDSKQHHGEEDG